MALHVQRTSKYSITMPNPPPPHIPKNGLLSPHHPLLSTSSSLSVESSLNVFSISSSSFCASSLIASSSSLSSSTSLCVSYSFGPICLFLTKKGDFFPWYIYFYALMTPSFSFGKWSNRLLTHIGLGTLTLKRFRFSVCNACRSHETNTGFRTRNQPIITTNL